MNGGRSCCSYILLNLSSIPSEATVRILSIASLAVFELSPESSLFLFDLPWRSLIWATPIITKNGNTQNSTIVRSQEASRAITSATMTPAIV